MQARYYDPVIGRFLSVDPVTFMDTGNPGYFSRYAYTLNDPINMIDPDGLYSRGQDGGGFSDTEWEEFSNLQEETLNAVNDAIGTIENAINGDSSALETTNDVFGEGADLGRVKSNLEGIASVLSPDSEHKAYISNLGENLHFGDAENASAENAGSALTVNVNRQFMGDKGFKLYGLVHEAAHNAVGGHQKGANGREALRFGATNSNRIAFTKLNPYLAVRNPDHLASFVVPQP